jgi:predicted ester cyclase
MFIVDDTVVTRLLWRGTRNGPYGGMNPTGKPVEIRDMAMWHFTDGKVTEIWTLQDYFGLLRQVWCLPDALCAA